MATTYCYICTDCNTRCNFPHREARMCPKCGELALRRDYRTEGVGPLVVELKREREEGGKNAYRDLFLPTNREFAGPKDPDGTKGMRAWRETHKPASENKRPNWPGEVERKVF